MLSTVKASGAEGEPVPEALVTVVVMLCAPWVSGVLGVRLQAPALSAVTLPMSVPLS